MIPTDPYSKELKSSPGKTAFEDARLASDTFHGGTEFIPEVTNVETAQISQLDPFQLLPEAFVRIQLWGIRW
jgi:hypothetical protein